MYLISMRDCGGCLLLQPARFWQNRIIAPMEKKYPEFYQNQLCQIKGSAGDIIYSAAMGRSIRKLARAKPFHLFSKIEIETINRCNNDCSFCPVNKNFDYIYLYTNGKLLTIEKFRKLMTCLDYIIIDNYSDDMSLINSIKIIKDYIINNTNNNYQGRSRIQSFRKNAVRSTRGGQAKNRYNIYQRKSLCVLPFSQLVIRPDGKISLCCQDALGKYTLGNLAQQTIMDAWNGEEYWKMRNLVMKGVHEIDLCRFCDHFHYLFHPFSIKSRCRNEIRRNLDIRRKLKSVRIVS